MNSPFPLPSFKVEEKPLYTLFSLVTPLDENGSAVVTLGSYGVPYAPRVYVTYTLLPLCKGATSLVFHTEEGAAQTYHQAAVEAWCRSWEDFLAFVRAKEQKVGAVPLAEREQVDPAQEQEAQEAQAHVADQVGGFPGAHAKDLPPPGEGEPHDGICQLTFPGID